jgi:glycosyltransferase involved in cell wall biosynthesis
MAALHQFVPTFEPGAVGSHMLELQKLWRESGRGESEIFAEHVRPPYDDMAHRFTEYGTRRFPARSDDVLVYQMAIGSTVADFVRDRREPLVLNHHNFTPVQYLQQWEPTATWGVQWGQAQLRELAPRTKLAVAVSEYNASQLREAGYGHIEVAPLLLDVDAMDREVEEEAAAALQAAKTDTGVDWLFVGRLAANKCQHDVVRAFAMYRRVYNPNARLHLVGGAPADAYRAALEGLVSNLGLRGAVAITGGVSPGALAAYYRAADVFVCLSEHEGFCAPLLEAMHHSVPVVAYAAAAVPETVDDAALLLSSKEPVLVAAAVDRVLSDGGVWWALVKAGQKRLAEFSLERTGQRWLEVLDTVVQLHAR